MSENLIQKLLRFKAEANRTKQKLEKNIFHKILMFIWPPHSKKYIISVSVIQTVNQALGLLK